MSTARADALGNPASTPSDVWRTDMENAPQDDGPVFVARRARGGLFFADAMLGKDRARDISTGAWCELAAWYPLPDSKPSGITPSSTDGEGEKK